MISASVFELATLIFCMLVGHKIVVVKANRLFADIGKILSFCAAWQIGRAESTMRESMITFSILQAKHYGKKCIVRLDGLRMRTTGKYYAVALAVLSGFLKFSLKPIFFISIE